MNDLVVAYLSFGLGFYVYAALTNPESFRNVPRVSIALGILGALLWPITIYLLRKR